MPICKLYYLTPQKLLKLWGYQFLQAQFLLVNCYKDLKSPKLHKFEDCSFACMSLRVDLLHFCKGKEISWKEIWFLFKLLLEAIFWTMMNDFKMLIKRNDLLPGMNTANNENTFQSIIGQRFLKVFLSHLRN